jgi:uncharacterized protein with GYD domain
MARYLVQAAYTTDAWATLMREPQDRTQPVRAMVEKIGGRLEAFYVSFGDYDLVSIVELPDNIAAAAVSIASSAGGAIKAIRTTPLLTIDETIEALTQAQTLDYQPPGDDAGMQTPIKAG